MSSVQAVPWVVNAGDRLRYEALFKQTDSDKDGFVSGVEIKNLLLQTGLPQNILAHIWNLCDMRQEGKLNPEQFALCMYLIHQKQAGKDPPAQLTPDMIPPSLRPKGAEGPVGANRSVYNNPELEAMAKEIQALLQVTFPVLYKITFLREILFRRKWLWKEKFKSMIIRYQQKILRLTAYRPSSLHLIQH